MINPHNQGRHFEFKRGSNMNILSFMFEVIAFDIKRNVLH